MKKGAKVYIEGALQTRKWQGQDGQDRYSTEVVLQGFNSVLTMLDARGGRCGRRRRHAGGRPGAATLRPATATAMAAVPSAAAQPAAARASTRPIDDEIPF